MTYDLIVLINRINLCLSMKHFFVQNWYKLITATSILFISLSCFIYSISNLFATPYSQTMVNTKALSHLNSDGSINVKLSDDQLRKISQYNEIQKVDIVKFMGEEYVHTINKYFDYDKNKWVEQKIPYIKIMKQNRPWDAKGYRK